MLGPWGWSSTTTGQIHPQMCLVCLVHFLNGFILNFQIQKGENETLPLKSFTKRNTCKAALGLGLFLHAES